MTVGIHNITIDCADPQAVAHFWARLLGWNVFYDDDPEILVAAHFPPSGHSWLFIPFPKGRTAKNRVHLDLQPTDCTRDEQVEAALVLGATIVDDHRMDGGSGWVTMDDPEGNDLCIERSAAETLILPTRDSRGGPLGGQTVILAGCYNILTR